MLNLWWLKTRESTTTLLKKSFLYERNRGKKMFNFSKNIVVPNVLFGKKSKLKIFIIKSYQ